MTLQLDDPRIAEFVGIMLGDGSIGIYKCKDVGRTTIMHQLKITVDSREAEYISYLCSLMSSVFNVNPVVNYKSNENTADIRIFRKKVIEFAISQIGLKLSPKWNNATIPDVYMRADLATYVLRGLFDTDGCVNLTNNNGTVYPRLELKICPLPMQNQVIDILNRNGFDFKVQNLDKGKIRIRLNGKKSLSKWMEIVGSNNPKHIAKMRKIIAEDGFEPSTFTQ